MFVVRFLSTILNKTILIDSTLRYLLEDLEVFKKNSRNVWPVLHQKGLGGQNRGKIQRLAALTICTKTFFTYSFKIAVLENLLFFGAK